MCSYAVSYMTAHVIKANGIFVNKYLKILKTIRTNTLKCLSIGTPKIINFPFDPNGKLLILGAPIISLS